MNRFSTRGVVAVSMIAALGLSTPAVAFADTTTTTTGAPSTTTTVSTMSTTMVKVNHANAWRQWRHAEEAYLDQLKVINRTFRATVEVARDAYRAAIKASRGSNNGSAARLAARAALTLSIANAMGARATALTSLGAPPAPPSGSERSAYILALQGINETYRTTVAAADATFAAAFATTTTGAQRATVRAALELSIANAAVVRAAALTTLGAPPSSYSTSMTTAGA